MPIILDLHYVDELIDVRREQHGGGRGAPIMVDGYREGESINRSCIVMLSALLQGFVEDVFIECSKQVLPRLATDQAVEKYRKTFRRWGNPNPNNIRALFGRIGIVDVLDGIRWRNCANATVLSKLDAINQIRNSIAHGRLEITVNGQPSRLSLIVVSNYRNFAEAFGNRFEQHAIRKLR